MKFSGDKDDRRRVDFDEGWMDSFGRKGEGEKCSLSFESRNMCCGITLNRNRRPVLFNIRSSSLNSRVNGYFFFELFSFSKIRRGILIEKFYFFRESIISESGHDCF